MPIASLMVTPTLEKIAVRFERMLRGELAQKDPISYQIQEESTNDVTIGAIMKDLGTDFAINFPGEFVSKTLETFLGSAIGKAAGNATRDIVAKGFASPLHNIGLITFDIIHPRQANLCVQVVRHASMAYAEKLLYLTNITKPIGETVILTSEFGGDKQASMKLNTNHNLIKKLEIFHARR